MNNYGDIKSKCCPFDRVLHLFFNRDLVSRFLVLFQIRLLNLCTGLGVLQGPALLFPVNYAHLKNIYTEVLCSISKSSISSHIRHFTIDRDSCYLVSKLFNINTC